MEISNTQKTNWLKLASIKFNFYKICNNLTKKQINRNYYKNNKSKINRRMHMKTFMKDKNSTKEKWRISIWNKCNKFKWKCTTRTFIRTIFSNFQILNWSRFVTKWICTSSCSIKLCSWLRHGSPAKLKRTSLTSAIAWSISCTVSSMTLLRKRTRPSSSSNSITTSPMLRSSRSTKFHG